MKNVFITYILLAILTINNGYAQPWLFNKNDKLKNQATLSEFEKEKLLFNEYWKNRQYEKGKGYKQFKRIEYFATPRTWGNNEAINSKAYWQSAQNFKSRLKSDNSYWEKLGPEEPPLDKYNFPSGIGRVNCLAYHPNDNRILYAGSPSGGLWKSTDKGETWTNVATNLLTLGITDIEIDYKSPNTIYISSGDGDAQHTYSMGVLKSTDYGETFSATSLSFNIEDNIHANSLCMSKYDPSTMYVSTNIGIYKTMDGWQTHKKIYPGECRSVKINPGDESIVVATTMSDEGKAEIIVSTDYGKSFNTAINLTKWNCSRVEIAFCQSNPYIAYAIACDAETYGFGAFLKSTDGGKTWFEINQYNKTKNILGWSSTGSDEGGQGWYDLAITIDPTNPNIIYVGGINIWKSTNGGSRWTCTSFWNTSKLDFYVHADIHYLSFDSEGKLYACSDGGVSVSENSGFTWKTKSNGINIAQLYYLSIRQGGNDFLCGTQDLGSHYYSNEKWKWVREGDGMMCFFSLFNPNEMYTEYYNGQIMRSYDNGLTFTDITPEDEYEDGEFKGAWVTPYIVSELEPSTLYAGYSKVYKSSNKGDSWDVISPNLSTSEPLTMLKQSPTDADMLVTSNGVTCWLTTTGGATWNEISSIPIFNYITDLCFATNDNNEMWISTSGYTENRKIVYSDNGGKSWINYSEGLPNVPVNCIVMQKESDKLLYCGTDIGIYYRTAHMDKWEVLNNNLPPVIVTSIRIDYSNNNIFIATFGRGVWKGPCIETTPYIDFTASSKTVCADTLASVTYTFNGTGNFSNFSWNFGAGAHPKTASGIGPHKVTYSELTIVDVSLSAYLDAEEYYEQKINYVTTVDEYDIDILASSEYSCGDTIEFVIDQPGKIIWQTENALPQYDTLHATFSLLHSQYVYAEVESGKCYDRDSIFIQYNADNICDAEKISLGVNGKYSNICASAEDNEPMPDTLGPIACKEQLKWCPENGLQNSVWFELSTPPSDNIYIETSGFNSQIAVYEAESCEDVLAGNYALIAANDDYFNQNSLLYPFPVEESKHYWLQVDGSGGGEIGEFYVNVFDSIPLIPAFSESSKHISAGETINFFDESVGNITEWKWFFEGGSPEKSTKQNPERIAYYESGMYSVALEISDGKNSKEMTKYFYIEVSGYQLDCEEISNYTNEPEIVIYDDNCGYIAGTNCYDDKAKAEKFSNLGSNKAVSSITIDFGMASGHSGSVQACIWSSSNGRPAGKIGTQTINISDIINDIDSKKKTTVNFLDPILVGEEFFAGIFLPEYGDSVAIKTVSSIENTAWNQSYIGNWQSINTANDGNYSLAIAVNLCKGAISISDVNIYPNPCKDQLTINFRSIDPEFYKFQIVDMSGRIVKAGNFEPRKSLQNVKIESLKEGVYTLKIYRGGNKHHIEFIKLK